MNTKSNLNVKAIATDLAAAITENAHDAGMEYAAFAGADGYNDYMYCLALIHSNETQAILRLSNPRGNELYVTYGNLDHHDYERVYEALNYDEANDEAGYELYDQVDTWFQNEANL
jgi:hypothetical protein